MVQSPAPEAIATSTPRVRAPRTCARRPGTPGSAERLGLIRGMIGAAYEGTRLDPRDAGATTTLGDAIEVLGIVEPLHAVVSRRRLQVLPHGEDVRTRAGHVVEQAVEFVFGLSQT